MPVSGSYIGDKNQILAGLVATKVAEVKLTADTTGVSFTGLNLEADKRYVIRCFFVCTQNQSISMYANNDTTVTHYLRQLLQTYNGTICASTTAQDSRVSSCYHRGFSDIQVLKISGQYAQGISVSSHDTNVPDQQLEFCTWTHVSDTTNITQLDLISNAANGLKIGTVIGIYRM